jgi:hypothetical protein
MAAAVQVRLELAPAPRPVLLPVPRPSIPRVAAVLLGSGLILAALAVLDPRWRLGAALGPLLVAGAAVPRRWRRAVTGPALILAFAFGAAAVVEPEFRADSVSYYAYLRSAVFDRDLDFANEWAHWGYPEPLRTPTGLRRNVQAIGPALLWSPFFVTAHAYVRLGRVLGSDRYEGDGYALPYRRSAALGTLVAMVAGASLLASALARGGGRTAAVLAVTTAVLASPVLYYAWVVPSMAHGAAFGACAAVVWAWDRARRVPSLTAWTALGALVGIAALMRWQAAVYVLMILALAAAGIRRGVVRWYWLGASAAAALAAFTPQLLVWKALYGRFLLVPQGAGFLDWTSPHLLDALVSADHGFFSWTPVMLLGIAGLVTGLRRAPLLHGGALAVFLAAAWVNGGVADWAASDAFGARRFDLVVPLAAVGLLSLVGDATALVIRAPLAAPAAGLALLTAWNLGLVASFRHGRYPESAPLERVARDQAVSLRRACQAVLGTVAGARGRALAYKFFSAEYAYSGNPSGAINLAEAGERWLLEGWGTRGQREGGPSYRWALYPRACVRIPLEEPFDMAVTVTLRAPRQAAGQVATLAVNGTAIGSAALDPGWKDVALLVPAQTLLPGENTLCLAFSTAAPGDVAAAVSRIQLP